QCLAVVKPIPQTVRARLQHREERTESELGIERLVVLAEFDMDVIVFVPGDRDGTEKRMEDPERHLKAADRYCPVIEPLAQPTNEIGRALSSDCLPDDPLRRGKQSVLGRPSRDPTPQVQSPSLSGADAARRALAAVPPS